MFEFITISNGVAVVQHASTGHVYRFRPIRAGVWSALTLVKVDESPPPAVSADVHAGAALMFAEVAASLACRTASESCADAPPPRRRRSIFSKPHRQPVLA